jgi:phosphoribosylanthranilate isomerase
MMVKICGITNQDDASAATDAGASALGFNFYARSPRYIDAATAFSIISASTVLRVGVFVDAPAKQIAHIAEQARLDIIQLHGSELPADAAAHTRVWKAFRVDENWSCSHTEAFDVEAILLDGPLPGTGQGFDWQRVRELKQKMILAGGLDDGNVAAAIRATLPWGVDACSRIESRPGIKDHDKMKRFIRAALAE